jgi:hypothetical protein
VRSQGLNYGASCETYFYHCNVRSHFPFPISVPQRTVGSANFHWSHVFLSGCGRRQAAAAAVLVSVAVSSESAKEVRKRSVLRACRRNGRGLILSIGSGALRSYVHTIKLYR